MLSACSISAFIWLWHSSEILPDRFSNCASRSYLRMVRRLMDDPRKEYLESKLKLKVNEKKSEAGCPLRLKFLGFSLRAKKKGQASIRIHEKSPMRD